MSAERIKSARFERGSVGGKAIARQFFPEYAAHLMTAPKPWKSKPIGIPSKKTHPTGEPFLVGEVVVKKKKKSKHLKHVANLEAKRAKKAESHRIHQASYNSIRILEAHDRQENMDDDLLYYNQSTAFINGERQKA